VPESKPSIIAVTFDCVVIGAGQAGLSASYHLRRLGVDHVVLERGAVGETWRTARWDSFCLNTPNWCTRLPGLDPPGEPDAFAPLEDVIATLTDYADRIRAPVRRGEVTALRVNRGSFELTQEGDSLLARSVVVATGAFQRPTAHPAAAEVPAGIRHLHTVAYRNPGALPDGGVLVVGSGQSGCEIAQELLEAGRSVHLAVGRCGWAPRRYRGRELMRWMVDVGAMDETSEVLPTPKARFAGNVAVSGSQGGRDCNPLVLQAMGARLYGRFLGFDGGRAVFRADLDENLEFGATFERDWCRRFDDYASAGGLDLPEHPTPLPGAVDAASTELALDREGVATVLWAGGFRPAFQWIGVPVFDELGFPRTRRGVTEVPGLTFVGLPWLYTRKSPLLLGVGDDAAHVADAVAAHLDGRWASALA
jgi:putative flavoprotein involved in K+ transport